MQTPPRYLLLTPGPLCTHINVRQAMLNDFGSWDDDFKDISTSVLDDLLNIAHKGDTYCCIPMQGSGTFAVEAAIHSLVPKTSEFLVLVNGAYGLRMREIAQRLGIPTHLYRVEEHQVIDEHILEDALLKYPTTTHVGIIHCETSTGIVNPIEILAPIIKNHGAQLLIDAMCSFGALPINVDELDALAVIASSNKCLEGVPGMGFVITHKATLEQLGDISQSLSLSLFAQWQYFEKTRQWRFTPPTHVVAALRVALNQYYADGGQVARLRKYQRYSKKIRQGMKILGFEPYLSDQVQGPMIQTFCAYPHAAYNFNALYAAMKQHGIILYPGKLTAADTFRVGNMGDLSPEDINHILHSFENSLTELGWSDNTKSNQRDNLYDAMG